MEKRKGHAALCTCPPKNGRFFKAVCNPRENFTAGSPVIFLPDAGDRF